MSCSIKSSPVSIKRLTRYMCKTCILEASRIIIYVQQTILLLNILSRYIFDNTGAVPRIIILHGVLWVTPLFEGLEGWIFVLGLGGGKLRTLFLNFGKSSIDTLNFFFKILEILRWSRGFCNNNYTEKLLMNLNLWWFSKFFYSKTVYKLYCDNFDITVYNRKLAIKKYTAQPSYLMICKFANTIK